MRDLTNTGYYKLMANMIDAYVDGKGRLVIVFDKRTQPELSVKALREMMGFTVTHFKKVD